MTLTLENDEQANGWAVHQTLFSNILSRPRPEWLIEGVLPQGSIVFVTGREATAKSFLVQSWAACIATGHDWMNRETAQGHVVYLALEGNPVFIVERFLAWQKHNKVNIDERRIPIIETFDYKNKGQIENLILGIQAGVAVVIIDTLAVFAGGKNLKEQNEVNFIQDFAQQIIRESRGVASVVIVAHSTKADDSGMSGSIQLNAMADMTWRMEKSSQTYKANILKSKNGKESEELFFKLLEVDLGDDISAGVLVATDTEPTTTRNYQSVAEIFFDFQDKWIPQSVLIKEITGRGIQRHDRTARDLLSKAVSEGWLVRDGNQRTTRFSLVEPKKTTTTTDHKSQLELWRIPASLEAVTPQLKRPEEKESN